MKPDERDLQVLLHIAYHCCVIEETIRQFGKDKERFDNSIIYRNAVSMPLMQIGELVKHLSARFKETHPEIPWKKISGMRDYFAHDYFGMNIEQIWNTALESAPELNLQCRSILQENDIPIPERIKS